MKLLFVISKLLVASLDHVRDTLSADPLLTGNFTEREIVKYEVFIDTALMFVQQFAIKII